MKVADAALSEGKLSGKVCKTADAPPILHSDVRKTFRFSRVEKLERQKDDRQTKKQYSESARLELYLLYM